MLAPGHEIIAGYTGWYMQARDAALVSVTSLAGIYPRAEDAYKRMGGFETVPWPWELADRGLIEFFASWFLDTYGPLD